MTTQSPSKKNVQARVAALIEGREDLKRSLEGGRYAQRAANLIADMRVSAGLSKSEFASRLGVSPARISEVEDPVGPNGPTYRFMCQAAEVCGFRWPQSIEDLQKSECVTVHAASVSAGETVPYVPVAADPKAGVALGLAAAKGMPGVAASVGPAAKAAAVKAPKKKRFPRKNVKQRMFEKGSD